MKQKIVQPKALDREKRESKNIKTSMERQRQHDNAFEKNLATERSRDDQLYADKDKFVTAAYKRKLAEQEKWMEEERLRELKEEKEDVTKKSDLSDFYFNIGKNAALVAKDIAAKKQGKQEKQAEFRKLENLDDPVAGETSDKNHAFSGPKFVLKSSSVKEAHLNETSPPRSSEPLDPKPVSDKPVSGTSILKEKLQLNNHRSVNQITIIIKEIKMH
ncbi:PREDICTED: nuclear speckle splicing regulatory protein 1-like isoform X2 [Populus euphratica]|uniref:Nuclear speckle splicing regulatory protein 1-like isoform X2 n=1 Tax=Populus euphratica TaxID=75702 RepID=A0AAJ6T9J0_POPEU|nr:PREDICTED: nuclear speckle splicing regulatory protein 1-like isoform X2 [Populus euphratica]